MVMKALVDHHGQFTDINVVAGLNSPRCPDFQKLWTFQQAESWDFFNRSSN